MPTKQIPVAVLGATGLVGQRLIAALDGHPWFELTEVAASERSAGKEYGQAAPWRLETPPPEGVAGLVVRGCDPDEVSAPLVFSALDATVAGDAELAFARAGRAVVSNARNHRMAEDVPLVVPEVNPEHLELVARQKTRHGGKGFIVTNPNCSTIGLTLVLAPLHRLAGLERVIVTTLQAASGAGYPGVPSLDLIDNVVPHIGGEVDKIESEPRKILAQLDGDTLREASFPVSAEVHRVPVRDGHLLSIALETRRSLDPEEALEALSSFRGEPQERALPTAPEQPILVTKDETRPQPRLDRMAGGGMSAVVGRMRRCPVLDLRFEALSHNTLRGAAGGTLLLGELLVARGLLP